MKLTLKLFASLAARLPPDARSTNRVDLDVPAGTTVADVIRRYDIPAPLCGIVLIDGEWVAPGDRAGRVLLEGNVLAIWPPVAGGSTAVPGPGADRVALEMTISREEFLRLLPAVVGPIEVDGEMVRAADTGGRWRIRLVPLPDRRLGSVAVPRHRVEITVETESDEDRQAFVDRILRGFVRGGG